MHRPAACLVPAFASLCFLAGCETWQCRVRTPTMGLHLDTNEMKAEVSRYVAIGMPIDEAKKVMETQGIKCIFEQQLCMQNAGWTPTRPGGVRTNYDSAQRYKPQRNWRETLSMSDEIKVYFSFKDGKVSEVRSGTHSLLHLMDFPYLPASVSWHPRSHLRRLFPAIRGKIIPTCCRYSS